MAGGRIVLIFVCLLVSIKAEIDTWQLVNRGGKFTVIAANDKAVYGINTTAHLEVMKDDNGFANIAVEASGVSVNGDYGIWIVKTNGGIHHRTGTSSSTVSGTSWQQIGGWGVGVVTGRYGLLFHFNSEFLYIRTGITPASHVGTGWKKVYGYLAKKAACAKQVCFTVRNHDSLWITRKFRSIDSPPMEEDWVYAQNDTSDISAYGDNILWRLDGSGGAWQAVNVLDNVFNKISWERRDYQTSNLKDIAVTDKVQYAVSKDNGLLVLTGCPIFDFEDNDLSKWVQTGTAFAQQPVVSQQTFYQDGPSGKVGDRVIDTYSGRKDYSMPENAPEATIGNTVIGTLTSPLFQIRTNMLHFVIGAGSPPNNYVGLYIDGAEKFQSAGRSKEQSGPTGVQRASRYWWDVTSYKEKCAHLKIIDEGTAAEGHTIFDDLRASPPCFKGMDITLTRFDHNGNTSVGQMITDVLSLKGFYTSKTRPLKIMISYPVVNGSPILYIENINISKTHCQSDVDMTQNMTSSSSMQWHTVTTYLENYLLSDAEIKIISRAYDHDDLQINSIYRTMIRVSVEFMKEYVAKTQKEVTVTRHGNETANIDVTEGISNQQSYNNGENVTYEVRIGHNSSSLQRAYNVMIKLFIPPYMTLVHVTGLENTHGDVLYSPSKSQHAVRIPELFLGNERTFVFDMRIDGEPLWNRKFTKDIQGQFLVDLISYCCRKGCQNAYKNGTEVKIAVIGKPYLFQFSNKKRPASDDVYVKLNDTTNGLVVICGPYDVMTEKQRPNCYYGNSTSTSWYSLDSMLRNISFYDAKNRVIFGTSVSGAKMRLHGERFEQSQMISNGEWNVFLADGGSLMKPKVLHSTSDNKMLIEPKGTANGPWNQWRCCGD